MDKCNECTNWSEPKLRYTLGESKAIDYQVVVCRDCGTERKIVQITHEDDKKFKGEVADLQIMIEGAIIEE